MNLTPIVRPYFSAMARAIDCHSNALEKAQHQVLASLIGRSVNTLWGREHGYNKHMSYLDFAEATPISDYPAIRPLIMRMIAGESDILCPGRVDRYACSSGTSDGRSKYLPIPRRYLRTNHYAGAQAAVAFYLRHHPHSRLFSGRSLILGGSYTTDTPYTRPHLRIGDLSATLIDCAPSLAAILRVPNRHTALMSDWSLKLPALVQGTVHAPVTNISGVPSWMLALLKAILAYTGASTINEVWPGLEVFFHGGISFAPYRNAYDTLIQPGSVTYWETYNASEGFIAAQDTPDPTKGMRLLADADIFYEFQPLDGSDPIPSWQAQQGETYALILTTGGGLWRYPIGDTVRVVSVSPLRITVAGRTAAFINAFGEEVMVWNTDRAISRAADIHHCDVRDYTVAPFYSDAGRRGRHQWIVEFGGRRPDSLEAFAHTLDSELQAVNSDYQAKRTHDLFLEAAQVIEAPSGLFDRWLELSGKLGGQRKIPRLCNDRHIIDPLIAMMNE